MTKKLVSTGNEALSGQELGRGPNWSARIRNLFCRSLKAALPAAAMALAGPAIALAGQLAPPSDLQFKLQQQGANVLMTVSGKVNTTSLLTTGVNKWSLLSSGNGDGLAYLGLNSVYGFTPAPFKIYTGAYATTPQSTSGLPTLGNTVPTTGTTSALVGIDTNPRIALDSSYVSESPINGTAVFPSQT